MVENSLEDRLVTAYCETFHEMLVSVFTSKGKIAEGFYLLPISKQREIEDEARHRSYVLAKGFVELMDRKGFLEKVPTEKDIKILFQKYLKEATSES